MSDDTDAVSVAVLVDDTSLNRWAVRSLSHMVEETSAEISLVIVNDEVTTRKERLFSMIADGAWGVYLLAYWLSRRLPWTDVPWYKESVPFSSSSFLSSADRISCTPDTDGRWNELPDDVIADLEETDLGVRFGFGLLGGDTLAAPTYGVVSFHGGDTRNYRGRPSGFWSFSTTRTRLE